MATHTVSVAWDSQDQSFPAGTIPGQVLVTIIGGNLTAPLSMSVDASPAVFPAVDEEADTDPPYVATMQRLDSAGNPLGAPASATFSVLAPPAVTIGVPVNPTVTVS